MQVTVKLFAKASQLVGQSEVVIEIPAATQVADFRRVLVEQHSELQPIIDTLFVAINADYADDEQVIPESAEIACFPPVSGG